MKRTLSTFLAIIMLLGAMSTLTNVFAMNYVFNAKDYATKYVCVKESSKDNSSSNSTTYDYNSDGKVTKKVYKMKHSDGASGYAITNYSYDKKGNLIKKSFQSKNPYANSYNIVDTYKYNSKNVLIKFVYKEIDDYDNSPVNTSKYKYDSKGNLIKYTYTYNERDGKIFNEYKYFYYNSKGNLTKKIELTPTDKKTITYKYDSKNHVIKKVEKYSISQNKEQTNTTTYKYNSKDNLSELKCVYKVNNSVSATTIKNYSYDKKGNIISEKEEHIGKGQNYTREYTCKLNNQNYKTYEKTTMKFDRDDFESTTKKYYYNNQNKLTKEITIESGSNKRAYKRAITYKYDKNNNMIKKTYYSGNEKINTVLFTYKKINKSTCINSDKILKDDFNIDSIRISNGSYIYDGKKKEPTISIESDYYKFQENINYTVTYKNNVKPGTAQAIISLFDDSDTQIIINYEIKPAKAK